MPAAVALRGITKRFPAVVANDQVDFEAADGEVHALLGENGAGKTTLSNILTGLYRPDEGEILLSGEPVEFHSPRDAHRRWDRDGAPALPARRRPSLSPRTSSSATSGTSGARFCVRSRAIEARVEELVAPVRPRRRPARAHLAALGRRAAARRGPEGALPGRAHPHPRRADRRADSAGSGRALRDGARDGGGRPHGDLHLAQAPRGEGGRGSSHRAATRTLGRDGCRRRGDATLAGRADGRPRGRDRAPPPRSTEPSARPCSSSTASGPTATAACRPSRTSRSRCAAARSSRSPASRATGSASSPRRSSACGRRRRERSRSAVVVCEAAIHAARSRPASPTSQRIVWAPVSRRA